MELVEFSLCLFTGLALLTATVHGSALYPYGPEYGDESGTITSLPTQVQMVGVTPVKYYGQTFTSVYISKDGLVALEPGMTYLDMVDWKEGAPHPAVDLPFIAPFHHKGLLPLKDPDQYPGKIYYKLVTRARNNPQMAPHDEKFLQELDAYVQNVSVVLKSGFTSHFALRVTWKSVSSEENCTSQEYASCAFNTFQLVLVGNTDHTFAIFNYYKMDIPFNEHHLAGMNGGHGRGWTDVSPCTGLCAKRSKSEATRITSLARRAGSDVQGRYILVVDGDRIYRGGCIPAELRDAELEVFPRQVGMFGGEMLSVSGRCLEPGTKFNCTFAGTSTSQGVMETTMRGRCPVPILTTRGEISLQLSYGNVPYKTYITVVLPSRLGFPVNTSNFDPWFKIDSTELKVYWRQSLFSSNPYARLDLHLIGYREDDDKPIFKHLEQLGRELTNANEFYKIQTSDFACSSNCQEFEIALVQLKIRDEYIDNSTKYQAVTMGPVPLGWYVKYAMTQQYGTEHWPAEKCKDWYKQDKQNTAWLNHLLPCPCTLTQALADWGRWQPDVGCSMFSGSVCRYHIKAKHCVRSVHPSPDGAGNQCCYEEDGNLRYAADTYQGSTPDRSHDWGATPYAVPGRVPSLSHWLHDVVTFYYCCLWVEDYAGCDYYMTRRPTQDCVAYTPPHAATVYGDPHITTFDGLSYYFGGSGDFWLLKSATINIQGRFEQRTNLFLQLTAQQLAPTNLTSVVMWIPGSDVITVRKAPSGGPADRTLDVMVGSQSRYFQDKGSMWQDFKRVSIVNNKDVASRAEDKNHNNFTILFEGGVGVQVAERHGLLHLVAILPPNIGQTSGLLGTLDGNRSNDFTTPWGTLVSADAFAETVYQNFSLKWDVNEVDSKFVWPKKALVDRLPLFGQPETFAYKPNVSPPSTQDVRSTCGASKSCARDYYVTSDNNVAAESRNAEESFAFLQKSQVIVQTCGLLDIPFAEKQPTIYLQGSTVTVTRCRDDSPFLTQGPKTYLCDFTDASPNYPVWSPEPDKQLCPSIEDVENDAVQTSEFPLGAIIGIIFAAIALIAAIVIISFIIVRRRRQSTNEKPVPAKRTQLPPGTDAGADETLLKENPVYRGNVRMSDTRKPRSRDEV